MKLKLKIILPLLLLKFCNAFSQTNEIMSTQVICSTKTGQWKILADNGSNVLIKGQFLSRLKKISTGHLFSYRYFKIENSTFIIEDLKLKCKKYGEEFKYVQSHSNRVDEWCLLADEQYIYEGIFTLRNLSSKSKIYSTVHLSQYKIKIN